MMKKPLIAILIIALVATLGWVFWHQKEEDQQAHLTLYGNVDIRQVSLAFEGSGRIQTLLAEEGDQIVAGTLLGKLDTTGLTLQLAQILANIEAQKQNLLRLENGARPEEIAQTQSKVNAAKANQQLAKQTLVRLQDVAKQTEGRGVSVQDLDNAKAQLAVAKANVAEMEDALKLIQIGPRDEDIAAARAQLAAIQAQKMLIQYQISQGQLLAPSNGVLRSRLLETGDMASPQRPVFTLALTEPKWIRVYVNEIGLGKVKPGMAATVTTDSHPDQNIQGKVGFISSVAEFTPKSVQTEELRTNLVYEVRIIVEDQADQLRLGQPVTVTLDTEIR
jgi:HlyD family secretion protein